MKGSNFSLIWVERKAIVGINWYSFWHFVIAFWQFKIFQIYEETRLLGEFQSGEKKEKCHIAYFNVIFLITKVMNS